jgi:hypothetical protein
MIVLAWIRNRLQKWLLPTNDLSDVLKLIDGSDVRIVGVNGCCLVSTMPCDGGESHALIREGQAMSRELFWKLHKKHGGGVVTWSDGTPYEPSDPPSV